NEVKERAIFINTGFLDRTGDEIHTSMNVGPMVRKGDMKNATWLNSYEKNNDQTGLETGFQGNAQIGKGMWAMPDKMTAIVAITIRHAKERDNKSYVLSTTAAIPNINHYHQIDYRKIKDDIIKNSMDVKYEDDILEIPI